MAHDVLRIKESSFFDSLRHELRERVTGKLGHIDEAVARALGFGTRAAMLAALTEGGQLRIRPDEAAFLARLVELGGTAEPGVLEDAYMAITSYDTGCCDVLLVDDPEDAGEGEDDGWTPPWELDEDDPLRMSWEHDMTSRGNR